MALNNKLTDLNNHLFEALERLNDDELMAGGHKSKYNAMQADSQSE